MKYSKRILEACMRKIVILIAVVMCAGVTSFGQNGLPQWRVIKELHRSDQNTGDIGPDILFTPVKNGVYRASLYMSATSTEQQNAAWTIILDWTDETGLGGYLSTGAPLNTGRGFGMVGPSIFSPQVGKPVRVYILNSDPPPQNATYNFVMTIEQLTH